MTKIRIAAPCTVPLARMRPVEGGHHCPECDRVVRDLRGASPEEARAAFAAGPDVCARIAPDAGGFARLRRKPVRGGALLAGAAMLAASLGGCGAEEEPAILDETTEPVVTPPDEGLEHDSHPGEVHTDQHTIEHGLAGAAVMIDDLGEIAPPPAEEQPADEPGDETEGSEESSEQEDS